MEGGRPARHEASGTRLESGDCFLEQWKRTHVSKA